MKKLLIAFIIFHSSFIHCFGQQTNLDSLYAVWEDQTQPDSLRVEAFKAYIENGFLFSNPDTVASLADELIAFGKEHKYTKAKASGFNVKGISFWVLGDYPKALNYCTQSLRISEQERDQIGIGMALNNIGLIYAEQGHYIKAIDYYTQSLRLKEQLGDKKGTAIALINIGSIYHNQGDYTKALSYYNQSLNLKKQLDDLSGMPNALVNIGNIYRSLDDYPKALEYYDQSLKIAEQLEDKRGMARALGNMGEIYQRQNEFSKALDYLHQSLIFYKQLGVQHGTANTLNGIGNIYLKQGDYPKALEFCEKGYELALSIGVLETQISACSCLYSAFKTMGKVNEALVYMEIMRAIEDSLHAGETAKKLQQMEFAKQVYQDSVETFEKERQIEIEHEEEVRRKNQSRNMAYVGGIIALLLAGSFYSRWRYVKKSKASLQTEKDRSDDLLLNILPEEIAQELKEKGKAAARNFDKVSIVFTDFKGFTEQSAKLSAVDLVNEINHCFEAFDGIIEKYGIEKIKTIGDAYMAAGGLPIPTDDSVKNTVLAALEMQAFIEQRKKTNEKKDQPAFEMRVGIHTGPVVAGIVGVKKFQYDIWGDTVNTASRMESAGEVGKVNISQATYELLKDASTGSASALEFAFESRGKIEAKGKGEMEMYFVKGMNSTSDDSMEQT